MRLGEELDAARYNAQTDHVVDWGIAFATEDLAARLSRPELNGFVGIHHAWKEDNVKIAF